MGSRRDPVDIVSNALFRPLVISLLQISQEGNCTCQIDVFSKLMYRLLIIFYTQGVSWNGASYPKL